MSMCRHCEQYHQTVTVTLTPPSLLTPLTTVVTACGYLIEIAHNQLRTIPEYDGWLRLASMEHIYINALAKTVASNADPLATANRIKALHELQEKRLQTENILLTTFHRYISEIRSAE